MKKCSIMMCAITAAAAAFAVNIPDYTTLIAHRGESIDAPENTLPAFKTAVERGFGFECDIYLSKDGRVFTFHDRDLKRTTGGVNTNRCCDVTWDEVSRLDVGNWGKWKGSKFAGTRPALLEEVLALARDGRKIYVEIKTGPEIVPYVKKVFDAQKNATPENALFISFNQESCKAVKEAMPEYKVYWLVSSKVPPLDRNGNVIPGGKWRAITPEDVIKVLKDTGADGVDINFNREIITKEFVDKVKGAGFEFHVWTIDDLGAAVVAFTRGADTVTTNRALEMRNDFNEVVKIAKSKDASCTSSCKCK